MVATASVLVITPGPAVRPGYLAHYLNDPITQAELRMLATGATIANLKKSVIEQFEVLVPSLEDQEKIVALGEALRHQSRIEARLAELRRIQLRSLLEGRAERNRGRSSVPGS
jgi:restriction endonuclease S subunit